MRVARRIAASGATTAPFEWAIMVSQPGLDNSSQPASPRMQPKWHGSQGSGARLTRIGD
jgi:hypothetical protein